MKPRGQHQDGLLGFPNWMPFGPFPHLEIGLGHGNPYSWSTRIRIPRGIQDREVFHNRGENLIVVSESGVQMLAEFCSLLLLHRPSQGDSEAWPHYRWTKTLWPHFFSIPPPWFGLPLQRQLQLRQPINIQRLDILCVDLVHPDTLLPRSFLPQRLQLALGFSQYQSPKPLLPQWKVWLYSSNLPHLRLP